MTSGPSRMAPIFLRGLSEPYGFWNTICTVLRSLRTCDGLTFTASLPASSRRPALGFSISATTRASVDLPQPDSPTTASVRPASTAKEMPPTACRCAGSLNMPRRMSYTRFRSRPSTTVFIGPPRSRRHRLDVARAVGFAQRISERIVAAHEAVLPGAQGRPLVAGGCGVGAAGGEQAAHRAVVQAGHHAGDGRQPVAAVVPFRHGGEECRG